MFAHPPVVNSEVHRSQAALRQILGGNIGGIRHSGGIHSRGEIGVETDLYIVGTGAAQREPFQQRRLLGIFKTVRRAEQGWGRARGGG